MADIEDDDDDAAPDEPVIGGGAKPGISLKIASTSASGGELFRAESAEIAGGDVTLLIKNEEGKEVSSSVSLPAPDPHAAPSSPTHAGKSPTPSFPLCAQFDVGFTVEAVKALCKKLFELGDEQLISVRATPCLPNRQRCHLAGSPDGARPPWYQPRAPTRLSRISSWFWTARP